MWIIPKSLTSVYVPASLALTRDLTEPLADWASACERSLMLRSKPGHARIWSRKWKTEPWTRLLSGLICSPFQERLFTERYASSLADLAVSPSALLVEALRMQTRAISFRPSQLFFVIPEPPSDSSRTSMESSVPDSAWKGGTIQSEPPYCSMSFANWREEVSAQRGHCAQRRKSGRRIAACASLSWPTATISGNNNRTGSSEKSGDGLATAAKVWPTASARDWKDSSGMKSTGVNPDGSERTRLDQLPRLVFGQAAQDQSNSSSSHLASSWATPRAEMDSGKHRGKADTLHSQMKDVSASWATPTARDFFPPHSPEYVAEKKAQGHGMRNLSDDVVIGNPMRSTWSTPVSSTGNGGAKGLDGGSGSRKSAHPDQHMLLRGSLRLNPQWVCCLMGYPIGHASPSCPASVRKNWPKFLNGCAALTIERTSLEP